MLGRTMESDDPARPNAGPTADGHVLDRPHRRMYRRIGAVAGMLLVAAGVWSVLRDGAVVDSLARAARSPDLDALALLVAAAVATQLLSAAVFHVLMRRHGRVGLLEMGALISASTLVA
jgi:hypothetical protein